MLYFLSNTSDNVFNNVCTEDETWIYFQNSHKSMWLLEGALIPTIPKHVISSSKAMIAVI